MSDRKQCFLAGVCCFIHVAILAQPEWPARAPLQDTNFLAQQPGEEINNEPPLILYQNKFSVLVYIDGEQPVITVDEHLRMYRLVNTPHLIIKNHHDNKYYLYGDRYWYVADSATYGYTHLRAYPEVIKLIDSLIKRNERKALKNKAPAPSPRLPLASKTPPQAIVTTVPAELIQTRGDALYRNIPGTSLLYAYNTTDDIFKDSSSQIFYVLLSGRWFSATSLNGPWTYVEGDKLPAQFKEIPDTSVKARVLTHVPGTPQAIDAVNKSKLLQATKVNRKTATIQVVYDGGAEFSSVSNTGLFVSENSNIPIVNTKDKYYALQDGVWFRSNEAIGPWEVSTERPPDIDKIPSNHRIYQARFVYIYDTTDAYVYTGYTSGYTNSYVQNNTIVWGTGWPYKAWYRRSYYPRPNTWGKGMYYEPGSGWKSRPGMLCYTGKSN